MSIKESYQVYKDRHEAIINDGLGRLFVDQETRYVHPFKIYGNVWYVGDTWVCVHLIDTGDGLLLIDAGNCGATAMLIQAIWEAGFDPKDVKWLVLSHGHVDHIGAVHFFRNMFGTKIYLGAPDAEMYRDNPELSFIQDATDPGDYICMPDVEINDGDMIRFGDLDVQFYMVPGHTMGTIACFFDAHEGNDTKRCGYYGGFGFNTLAKDYLIKIENKEYKTRNIYLNSLAKVRDEKVDIFLGNHTKNNQTMERRKKMLDGPEGPNPFIDEKAWKDYLDQKKAELLSFMADPDNN